MTTVTHLLAALGSLTAVVLLLVMAAVPLLLDLPLRPRNPGRPAARAGDVDERRAVTQNAVWPAYR